MLNILVPTFRTFRRHLCTGICAELLRPAIAKPRIMKGSLAEYGHLLTDRKNALECWRDYLEKVSTMAFPHPAIPPMVSVHGTVHKITVEEARPVLKKMKLGKARDLGNQAADLWKSKLQW